MELRVIGQKAKDASFLLGKMGSAEKNKGLLAAAEEILNQQDKILTANAKDIEAARQKEWRPVLWIVFF